MNGCRIGSMSLKAPRRFDSCFFVLPCVMFPFCSGLVEVCKAGMHQKDPLIRLRTEMTVGIISTVEDWDRLCPVQYNTLWTTCFKNLTCFRWCLQWETKERQPHGNWGIRYDDRPEAGGLETFFFFPAQGVRNRYVHTQLTLIYCLRKVSRVVLSHLREIRLLVCASMSSPPWTRSHLFAPKCLKSKRRLQQNIRII